MVGYASASRVRGVSRYADFLSNAETDSTRRHCGNGFWCFGTTS